MDSDLFLTIGIILAGFSIPSILSAFSEGRAPRTAAVLILIASVLIVLAITQKPSGYTFNEIPDVFVRTIGRLAN